MKIEQKHGTKIPAYAAGAAMLAATTLLGGCTGILRTAGAAETTADPETSEELVLDGEETICTDDYIDESTDVTHSDPGGYTGGLTGPMADYCIRSTAQYEMFMRKIDEIEATAPGEYGYVIKSVQDDVYKYHFFVLTAYSGIFKKSYASLNGEMVELDIVPADYDISTAFAVSYEVAKSLPFLLDTESLFHDQVTLEGVKKDQLTPLVDSIEDGDYYGELLAVSDDGTRVLMKIGKPVVVSYSWANEQLQADEALGFMDFVKSNVKPKVGDFNSIVVVSPSANSECEFYLKRYYNNRRMTDSAYLMCDFDHWVEDYVIVELPLAEACKVFNFGEYFEYKEDVPGWGEDGDTMIRTQFFIQLKYDETVTRDSGWTYAWNHDHWLFEEVPEVYSVIVENGEVVMIEMNGDVT